MVRQRAKAIKKVEDTTWMPKAVETIRDLVGLGVTIDIPNFASATDLKQNHDEAESRLRKLTQKGWLYMSAEKSVDGEFERFVWELR